MHSHASYVSGGYKKPAKSKLSNGEDIFTTASYVFGGYKKPAKSKLSNGEDIFTTARRRWRASRNVSSEQER
ncbi:hypothetical protein Y032_0033g2707 [Ancylostoma ceylanicum]|uniref:Uncharacterized protein n=1 Tax=Ancylostoma ceylanicum TaxID=53326 RepID=A0A016UN10_9BILA|nr:hypothetical protein Y032_0033g2707 [Ancylostoma ceylanicum]